MKQESINWNRMIGIVLIMIPILIQIPYTMLIIKFQYPDILRQPTETILTEFHNGGSSLIWTWWFFGMSGLPSLFAYLHLYQNTKHLSPILSLSAMMFGVVSLFFQLIGLLRWVFVVPILSNQFIDLHSSEMMKQAVVVNFQTIHHLFGVLIGEHLGQLFTILWMFLVSIVFRKNHIFSKWISNFGLISAFLYLLAQFELFSLVIPEVKEIPFAGLVGSLCWLVWMMALGIQMLKSKN